MGLDQYIIRAGKNAATGNWEEEGEVHYFRKFNALHNWVTENCENTNDSGDDNCSVFLLTDDNLDDLSSKCVRVLDCYKSYVERHYNDLPEKYNPKYDEFPIESPDWSEGELDFLESTLPTCSGFFFGDTSYDRWYFRDVKELYDTLQSMLEDGIDQPAPEDIITQEEADRLKAAYEYKSRALQERSDYLDKEHKKLISAYLTQHPTNPKTGEPTTELDACFDSDVGSEMREKTNAYDLAHGGNPNDWDVFEISGVSMGRQYTEFSYGYYAWY